MMLSCQGFLNAITNNSLPWDEHTTLSRQEATHGSRQWQGLGWDRAQLSRVSILLPS